MKASPALLFVCLGNICRSPLAEGVFRDLVTKEGLKVTLDSAGTGDWHIGSPPDKRAQVAAFNHGLDISGLRGRQVTRQDFYLFDYIIAMDSKNLTNLKRLQPKDGKAKLSLLMDYVTGYEGKSVADPYHGGAEDFEKTWKDVSTGAKALLTYLQRQHTL
ncbi:MAG: low molecular weight protein-tyrosine-phosphatase [Zymomonas mobilis subsp. pomaceae]|uniref:protein-tyrosine-phosphatase n=1 Tax=Zymomonas mobilis subsp. pomaceae (strain ATCC 29192 / DSM 22645 / JCM 10191 / CCUG 17912 / NBRC 13757 / NCIMB 11200 / NRRL B-4491 / Barker I) TaxID=579138 RepID=F8ETD0_ZYMMT|nr:low molecular weight protein-tyrosine-phosphatase [Zymomonas mobilis]AEI37955.1 protein tyrosine phosphatase [Zymomonas mobilis subsp. pomaceae ATCC 29192]MDX5949323.1 low molecular weight protein-tyrosine-phosphatase [Zymomonas mobilis subsp. pomaceae]GEB89670.1 phosphotyrosine protein phosphatase [Zymomonas mobilis subsp. pomaceae]